MQAVRHLDEIFFNMIVTYIPIHFVRKMWMVKSGAKIGRKAYILRGTKVFDFPKLTIGNHVNIGFNCFLDARQGIVIGDNVVMASDVQIISGGHDIADPNFSPVIKPDMVVTIEDYAWVTTRATILGGVTIGRGAVVSACSCVMWDVPPLTVVLGVPAKPLSTRPESALDYEISYHLPMY